MSITTTTLQFRDLLRYSYGWLCPYSNGVPYWRWTKNLAELRHDAGNSGRDIRCVFSVPSQYKYAKSIKLYTKATTSNSRVHILNEPLTNVENRENGVVYEQSYNWFLQYDPTALTMKNAIGGGFSEVVLPYNANGYQISPYKMYTGTVFDLEESYLVIETVHPEVSYFKVDGTNIDNAITCTWNQSDVTHWKVEAIKNNQVKATKTGTTATSCIFNAGDIREDGKYTFKITAYYNSESVELSKDVTLSYTMPEISNFEVVGNSIDSPISCSWTQKNVTSWKLEAIKNNIVKATATGTDSTSYIFNTGSLTEGGDYIIKLTCYYKNVSNTSVETSKNITLSYTQAKATIIDIPGTTINVDENLTIAWVSENQTSFSLTLDGKTYTGTTEKSITLPGGSISHGSKTITLTVTYTGAYYSNSATISTTFIAYGKPNTPVITSKSMVSSATPYIAWESDGQVSYRIIIKKILNTVEDSGEVISTNKYHKITNALENNTTYVATLKIKNQYNLWSDEVTLEFTTQFNVPNTPTIQAFSSNGSIVINVSTNITGDSEYKNTEIWKREPLGKWKRMAYNLSAVDAWEDKYVGNGVKYEYKARNIGQTGGVSESDVVAAIAEVKGYTFYNVEDMDEYFSFKYDVKITPHLVTNIVSNLFAGSEAPITSTDGVMYWQTNIQFSTKNREDIISIIKLMKKKVLLFKDCKGHKHFGNIVGGPSLRETDLGIITISLEFTDTSFLEEDVYGGGNTGLKIIKWDGTWKFDGTQSFHS